MVSHSSSCSFAIAPLQEAAGTISRRTRAHALHALHAHAFCLSKLRHKEAYGVGAGVSAAVEALHFRPLAVTQSSEGPKHRLPGATVMRKALISHAKTSSCIDEF